MSNAGKGSASQTTERMQTLGAPGLTLEPLLVAHADAMFPVLADARLYEYLDDPPPPSVEHLRHVYARLERRLSPDGAQQWLNWVLRLDNGELIGFVQATVVAPERAWIAYLLASKHWGRGHARSATAAMINHLIGVHGCTEFLATVEAENRRSVALLETLNFCPATAAELDAHDLTASERLYIRRVGR